MRRLSPDPVSGKPAIPISWNRYLYCRNDPINYFDPDGEDVVPSRIISGNRLIGQVMAIEYMNPSFSPKQVLKAWNDKDFADRDKYLAAPKSGLKLDSIDVKHFMRVAEVANTFGETVGKLAGAYSEYYHLDDAPLSFCDDEDLQSNALGAQFGEDMVDDFPLSIQLDSFLETINVIMRTTDELKNHQTWIQNVHPPGQDFYEAQ